LNFIYGLYASKSQAAIEEGIWCERVSARA